MEAIMSDLQIDAARLISILQNVAFDLKSHAEDLRELDAKLGDGDLGVTVGLASQAIADYLANTRETDIGKLLAQCGLNVNRVSPSTFGTILASAFMGGGKAVTGKTQLGLADLVLVGEGALENIQKRGKAVVGDKTVVDALSPAVAALKKEIGAGVDDRTAITAAVSAAEAGMQATVNMKAKFGRAQWFQQGSVGIQDSGATAMYYLIKSFAASLPV
jgi:phosphoenolpyruvate---glycerone phosphotransferase subunit DhaL